MSMCACMNIYTPVKICDGKTGKDSFLSISVGDVSTLHVVHFEVELHNP